MKNILYLLMCFLMLACGQGKEVETATTLKDTVQQSATQNKQPNSVVTIKQAYESTVNQLQAGQLDSVSYRYNCQQERSGKISYFSQNGKLLMIKHHYNEYDHFKATDQYFVRDDQLYFAYLNRLVWSFVSGGGEGAIKDDITENRLYFVDRQSILCLEKKFTIIKNANDNPQADKVPNKVVKCKPINALLKDFHNLLQFKDKPNRDCLEK